MTRNIAFLFAGLVLGLLATCALTHHSNPAWEYKAVWINPEKDMGKLNLNGADGWEISAVIPTGGDSCVILKRQK